MEAESGIIKIPALINYLSSGEVGGTLSRLSGHCGTFRRVEVCKGEGGGQLVTSDLSKSGREMGWWWGGTARMS